MTSQPAPHYSESLYRAHAFEKGSRLARFFPRWFLRRVGWIAGWLYAWTHPAKLEPVTRNLSLLSPKTAGNAAARRVFANFGKVMADYVYLGPRTRSDGMAVIEKRSGIENLMAAHAGGRGCILATAHFGFFELGGLLTGEVGYPTVALTKPEPSAELGQWRADYRKRWGVETIEVGRDEFAFLDAVKELEKGKFVAVLVDRAEPAHAVPVAYSGGTVPFSTGAALMALIARCPIVPCFVVEKPNGNYYMEAFTPIYPDPKAPRKEAIESCTRAVGEALRPVLERDPEQWYQFVHLTPP